MGVSMLDGRDLQHEVAQPDPQPGRISRGMGRFVEYLMDAGKPVVTTVLLMAAQQYGLRPT